MRVRMKTKIGGFRNGVEWPDTGQCIDVPAHEAAGLIANHYAEEAPDADENNPSLPDGGASPALDSDASDVADSSEATTGVEGDELTPEPESDEPESDEPESDEPVAEPADDQADEPVAEAPKKPKGKKA